MRQLLALSLALAVGACGKGDKKSGGGSAAQAVDPACATKRSALQKVFQDVADTLKESPLHETELQAGAELHAGREKLVAIDEGTPADPRGLKIIVVGKMASMLATRGALIDVQWDTQVDPDAAHVSLPGEVIPDEPLIMWFASDVPGTVAMNFLRRAQMDRLGKLRVAYRLKPASSVPAGSEPVDIADIAEAAAKEATRACPALAADFAELVKHSSFDADVVAKMATDIGTCKCDVDPKPIELIASAIRQPAVTFVPVMFGENGAAPAEQGATWADVGPAFAQLAAKGPIRFPEPPPPSPPPKKK